MPVLKELQRGQRQTTHARDRVVTRGRGCDRTLCRGEERLMRVHLPVAAVSQRIRPCLNTEHDDDGNKERLNSTNIESTAPNPAHLH